MNFINKHFVTLHTILGIVNICLLPAVQSSMPEFREKMKDRLRTPEEGADTMVWLAISPAARQQESGLFFQGELTSIFNINPFFTVTNYAWVQDWFSVCN